MIIMKGGIMADFFLTLYFVRFPQYAEAIGDKKNPKKQKPHKYSNKLKLLIIFSGKKFFTSDFQKKENI